MRSIPSAVSPRPQAVRLVGWVGQNQMVGIARPSEAPIWLPVAVASGCRPLRYFLVKLAATP